MFGYCIEAAGICHRNLYMAGKVHSGEKLIATNKKAFHDYFILEKIEAGISLLGTEVKAIREGRLNLKDSYALVRGGEVFLINCHISPYSHGNRENHEPTRARKLLLHLREIRRLIGKTQEKGLTLVPLRVYLKRGKVKFELGVAKGKKLFDKRETARRKEADKEAKAALKYRR
jgi:SsrA-binding protein